MPTLVKIADDEFVGFWNEYTSSDAINAKSLKYVKVNGLGQVISAVQTKEKVYLANV